jgi:hypothetical protein
VADETTTTTTAAPAVTTTAEPSATTTAPSTTTTPASTTTVSPGTTTTLAPGSTTTAQAGSPTITSVEVDVDPDDGGDHHDHSIEVSADATLTLKWETSGATGMHIDGLGDFDPTGSQDLPTQNASYTLTATGDGGAVSDPWPLEVHVHGPDDVVSQHVDVSSGVAAIVSFTASKADQTVTAVNEGDSVQLLVVASDATESVTIAGQDAALDDTDDGQKQASVTVTIEPGSSGQFEAQALAGGSVADTQSIQLDVMAGSPTTTTTSPSSTTTSAATTTTSPLMTTTAPATSTTAPGTTTTAGPLISMFKIVPVDADGQPVSDPSS